MGKLKVSLSLILILISLTMFNDVLATSSEVIVGLLNQTTTTNGQWILWTPANAEAVGSVVVTGITTATVQVRVSNDATVPANTDHGIQLGADITASGGMLIDGKFKWIKLRVSAYTSGTINANYLRVTK